MNFNDVNYKNMPTDDECVVNAVQIARRLGEQPHTIRMWAESYEDCLYVKKINGRLVYTEASVSQFEFIQKLIRKNKFTHAQIREHIDKHGFEYTKFDSGLVTPEDPLGFQALAVALSMENNKQLQLFLGEFMQLQEENNQKLISSIKEEVAMTVQDIVEIELENHYKAIEEELKVTRETNEKMDKLIKLTEERKEDSDSNNKKGLFSKWFK